MCRHYITSAKITLLQMAAANEFFLFSQLAGTEVLTSSKLHVTHTSQENVIKSVIYYDLMF